MSINRKATAKNAWRITKNRNTTALRVRVPGGHLETQYFELIRKIADDYGNGSVHITTRQGFEIPDIPWEKVPEINRQLAPLIDMLQLEVPTTENGYPAAGTRNISACVGNRVCPSPTTTPPASPSGSSGRCFPTIFTSRSPSPGAPTTASRPI